MSNGGGGEKIRKSGGVRKGGNGVEVRWQQEREEETG